MLTTDLALRFDPAYEKISRRFYEHPDQFADAFARAWFKLTHRDMGPIVRYLGPLVPKETLIWQDPIPAVDHPLIDDDGHRRAQGEDPRLGPRRSPSWFRRPGRRLRPSAAPTSAAAETARASASSPQKDWEVNQPAELAKVRWRSSRRSRRTSTPRAKGGKKVSLADLIVLGGGAAIEKAAKDAGHDVKVPFTPGRMDASQEETDVESVRPLEPTVRRVPQLLARPRSSWRPRRRWSTGRNC